MANFSVNQVRNLYVAEAYAASITTATAAKTISVTGADGQIYFTYVGGDGILRSDLIDVDKITYAKAIPSSALARPLRQKTVTLSTAVNGGAPIPGQIYVLGINILEFGSLSPEDTYYKNAAVTATTGMTAAQFYTAMANALTLSFKREAIPMFTFTASATNLVITEIEQPWRLGVKSSEPILSTVTTGLVTDSAGLEANWGTVVSGVSSTLIQNGKKTADLEYFCMGERGDIYRNVCFPLNIETTYFVDPTKAYDYIELQFHYTGIGNAIQESLKHVTIVVPTGTVVDDIVTAINTAAGKTVLDPLDDGE